jgi:mxaA protein
MIVKSDSISLALATIAVLGQAPRKRLVAALNRFRWLGAVVALLCLAPAAQSQESQADPVTGLRIETGRTFGYVLGDLIHYRVVFAVNDPYRLEKTSLPRQGPLDQWMELRSIEVAETRKEERISYEIDAVYQIFPLIREPKTLEIPGLPLRLYDGVRDLTFDTPAMPIHVSTLIPGRTKDAAVMIRPEIEPAPVSLSRHWRTLGAVCAASVLVLGYLAWRRDLLPFLEFKKSPFATARKELRRLRKAKPASTEYRHALRAVHRALNETAGETIFASGLECFFRTHPAFSPMRAKTTLFFSLSQQVFYFQSATVESTEYTVEWLEQLCREYHIIERSS